MWNNLPQPINKWFTYRNKWFSWENLFHDKYDPRRFNSVCRLEKFDLKLRCLQVTSMGSKLIIQLKVKTLSRVCRCTGWAASWENWAQRFLIYEDTDKFVCMLRTKGYQFLPKVKPWSNEATSKQCSCSMTRLIWAFAGCIIQMRVSCHMIQVNL